MAEFDVRATNPAARLLTITEMAEDVYISAATKTLACAITRDAFERHEKSAVDR